MLKNSKEIFNKWPYDNFFWRYKIMGKLLLWPWFVLLPCLPSHPPPRRRPPRPPPLGEHELLYNQQKWWRCISLEDTRPGGPEKTRLPFIVSSLVSFAVPSCLSPMVWLPGTSDGYWRAENGGEGGKWAGFLLGKWMQIGREQNWVPHRTVLNGRVESAQ